MTPLELAEKQRDEQLKHEMALARTMLQLYSPAERRIEAAIEANSRFFSELDDPANWTPDERCRIETFLAMIRGDLSRLAMGAATTVYAAKRESAERGAQDARRLARALGETAPLVGLSSQELAHIATRTLDGQVLDIRFLQMAEDTVDQLRSILQQRGAMGWPRRELTARLKRTVEQLTRIEVLALARNEAWQAYGETLTRSYTHNWLLLAGWVWRAQLDERTCVACLAIDGSIYPVYEPFQSMHLLCRCVPLPALALIGLHKGESGVQWFSRQPPARQRKMLGAAKYQLYHSGAITLPDLVERVEIEQAKFVRVKSVKQLLKEGTITQAEAWEALKNARTRGRDAEGVG